MWYDAGEILSYNCLFNFVVGNRGGGKTFNAKERMIKRFIKNGEQFIYLRRYKEEIKNVDKFFDDIAYKFPDFEFHVNGKEFYCKPKNGKGKITDKKYHMGGALALTRGITLKSVPYPHVSFIIFDEFITDPKTYYRYLNNEVEQFFDMYETICRDRDNVRVLFLANAISVVNPYFLYFDVKVDNNKRFIKPIDDVIVEMYKDDTFIKNKLQTRFGRLISKTRYGKYAINNEFKNDNSDFIEKKTNNAKLQNIIHFNDLDVGFWYDFKEGKIYASSKIDKTCPFQYTLKRDDQKPNLMLIKNAKDNYYVSNIMKAFELGYLFYENHNIKNVCYEIMKTLHYS